MFQTGTTAIELSDLTQGAAFNFVLAKFIYRGCVQLGWRFYGIIDDDPIKVDQVRYVASAKRLQMMAEENFKSISEVAGPVNIAKETLSQVLTTHFLAVRKPNEDDKGDDEGGDDDDEGGDDDDGGGDDDEGEEEDNEDDAEDEDDKNDKADDEFYRMMTK